jgi:hypothetical protein
MVKREKQVENEAERPSKSGNNECRLLALEIRPRKAGFAILEGSALLDWGVTSYDPVTPAIGRIASLLDLHGPSVIVTRRRPDLKNDQVIAGIVESIREEARRRSMGFQTLDADRVRSFFTHRGRGNKHEVALLIAEWFPELAWRVPPKRRPWQSEPKVVPLFDAVATAVTFLTGESSGEKS